MKSERLGTLGIVCSLSITCFELLRQVSESRSVAVACRAHRRLTGVLLILSLVVNLFAVRCEWRRGREFSSMMLLANASHTAGADIAFCSIPFASSFTRAMEGDRLAQNVATIPGVKGVRTNRLRPKKALTFTSR